MHDISTSKKSTFFRFFKKNQKNAKLTRVWNFQPIVSELKFFFCFDEFKNFRALPVEILDFVYNDARHITGNHETVRRVLAHWIYLHAIIEMKMGWDWDLKQRTTKKIEETKDTSTSNLRLLIEFDAFAFRCMLTLVHAFTLYSFTTGNEIRAFSYARVSFRNANNRKNSVFSQHFFWQFIFRFPLKCSVHFNLIATTCTCTILTMRYQCTMQCILQQRII